jgi:hypothetical protein
MTKREARVVFRTHVGRGPMHRLTGVVIVVLSSVLVACSDPAPPPPSPSASPFPEPPDANPISVLHQGTATVTYRGDLQGHMEFDFEFFNADASFTGITWGSGFATLDLYAGPGRITKGTQRSGPALGLQLRLAQSDTKSFLSGRGNCTITFTRATEERVSGTISCTNMKAQKGRGRIDLEARFDAQQ